VLIGTTPLGIVQNLTTATLGMVGLGAAVIGYFVGNLRWYERVLAAAAGLGAA
jgi:TRAP-type uncharacterized transport system fused permease subunit